MITVTRTRLDDGTPAVVRATADRLDIALDDRHITPVGAIALESALNGLAPGSGHQPTADGGKS
ncbi:hypothetical protein [Streptomyces rapamycinicus]|uniref:Uncharacterized protein n=1 Tax=Streptomyces rapamycinicus TaxID=1226757 RepID=A0ABR6LQ40_9ACTN|nr:hypothetical protein [Streptomyces rapamycinicus]AGP56841.1 hypothetical protein M271_26855 [Streptomyces rapamycinicus NRRL 5491]MBB4784461.1 hypothetical protein [Streptomyces rapamycinicus]UTO64769.1 hypothetical protein LJB45_22180 [Streptomyces rapamycinicus]UTP32726.1 hypothetical protein LIV37_27305 [Streptomyces rapamycinicus NRRL 5491]